MNENKCVVCKSKNLEFLSNSKHISKRFRKVEGNMTTEGSRFYNISEYLCLDCGHVMQLMEKGMLKNYIEDKPYFY